MLKFEAIIKNGLNSYDAWSIDKSLMLVILSVSDLCNRVCDNCPRGHGYVHPVGLPEFMSVETVELICEQLGNDYKGTISVSGLGEPTLCSDLIRIIKIIKRKCPFCTLGLITNGYKLTDIIIGMPELDWVTISVYEEADYKYYYSKFGNTRVKFKRQYFPYLKDGEFNNRAGNIYKIIDYKNSCLMPFFQITVDTDGSCYMCSCDWMRECTIGNVYEKSIKNIFMDGLKQVRLCLLLNHRGRLRLCRACSVSSSFDDLDITGQVLINSWKNYYGIL